MGSVWEQRIKHFDRKLKPLGRRRLHKRSRSAALRESRGLPSRAVPMEIVLEQLQLKLHTRLAQPKDQGKRRDVLEFKLIRSRLLERKRNALARIRSRRVTKRTSGINLWRTRLEWLARVEALQLGRD